MKDIMSAGEGQARPSVDVLTRGNSFRLKKQPVPTALSKLA